mgnify:CR=1 FL=1
MGFFRLLLRPRWRLFFFGLVALGLQIALLLISPAQVPVVLYKLALVMLAAILGMFFDVACSLSPLPIPILTTTGSAPPEPCGFGAPISPSPRATSGLSSWPACAAPPWSRLSSWPCPWGCEHGGDGETPAKGRFPHGEVAHDDSHGFDDGAAVRAVSVAGAGVGYSAGG